MADVLLARLAAGKNIPANRDAPGLAARMGAAGWGWAPYVLAALGQPDARPDGMAMRLGKRLPKCEEVAPRPPPSAFPVTSAQARARLATLLGPAAEQRPAQADYASAVSEAFAPRLAEGSPHVVIAEAGTGTGKTSATSPPPRSGPSRTRARCGFPPTPGICSARSSRRHSRLPAGTKVVLRKGRENYLCLLNFEDA